MSNYVCEVPPTEDQGSTTMKCSGSATETHRQNALWHYNKSREADGQAPLSRMPNGTTYRRFKESLSSRLCKEWGF